MRIVKKRFMGRGCEFLCPDVVERIEVVYPGYDMDGGPKVRITMDGRHFVSNMKWSVYQGAGWCFLYEEGDEAGEQYLCDDVIVIAAMSCAFYKYTYHDAKRIRPLQEGDALPLFTRELARQYLQWHGIPHPGIEI